MVTWTFLPYPLRETQMIGEGDSGTLTDEMSMNTF